MTPSSPIRILLAAAPVSREPIARALAGGHEVVVAHTLQQAKSLLLQPIDMILCGLYFDESRMFDLLRYARAEQATKAVPFLAVKASDGALSPAVLQGVEIACAALGAERFIELTEWERNDGTEQAHARFRTTIERILSAPRA